MRPTLLQLPDAVPNPVESALGFRLPFACQVSGFAECQMHVLVEVVARLAVAAKDVVGDELAQVCAGLVEERFVLIGQLDP